MGEALQALVIGGTSFFGRHIVRGLLVQGHGVAIFSRGNRRPDFWREVEHIPGDRSDHARFKGLLRPRRFDVVVDNIAYTGEDVKACIEAFGGRLGHYLLCSSGSVYRDYWDERQYRPYYEEAADLTFRGDLAYSEGKRAAELALFAIPEEERAFPFTIVRPPVVEGPGDDSGRTWFWVQRVADGGPLLVPRAYPSSVFRTAFAEDVARVFLTAMLNPRAYGRAYNVAADEIYTLEDYLTTMGRAMGREPAIASPPFAWVKRQPGLEEYDPPLARERFVPDISRARADLAYRSTPFAESMARTARWFLGEYEGGDSEGYARRAVEVEAARRWLLGG